jgi:hypothetical protein
MHGIPAGYGPLWDMIEKYGALFARATIHLSEAKYLWAGWAQGAVVGDPQTGFVPLSRPGIEAATRSALTMIREACLLADLERLTPELARLEQLIWPPYAGMPSTGGAMIATAITHFISSLQDELKRQYFFHVPEQDVPFYGKEQPFGEAVTKKFKEAAEDIERAGNCLALQQPTACVFHLMRAMEVVVRKLSRRLNVTITPQTTWRQMTGAMDIKIKAMPEKTEHEKRKKNDWEEARANLHHVGSVWRNNTMHPATSYTQSQARDVFSAVRVFMAGLADL